MTNFATILNDLAASFEGRNEYISRLCSFPLLILDDFGMLGCMAIRVTKKEEVAPAINKAIASGSPVPVSYTHLDVYKRQDFQNGPAPLWMKSFVAKMRCKP